MATNDDKDTEYVCTLSDDLVLKAQEELNEKPEWRSRDIQALREMILKKQDLKIRTDDAYLLRFLRAKKFDYDRAFNLVIRHFEMKADEKNKQLFRNLRPTAIKHVLEAGVTGVLPNRDKFGRRVIVFRPGKWDPSKYPLDDLFRTNFLTLSKLVEEDETQITGVVMIIDTDGLGLSHVKRISPFYAKKISSLLQDEETQVSGIVMFMDLKGMGFSQFRRMSPFYAKRIASLLQEEEAQINGLILLADLKSLGWKHMRRCKPFMIRRFINSLQDCFPMRFKGIHYVNEPALFDYVFALIRPFMKQKILDRIHFHGTKYEELTEYIDVNDLPSDYGGNAPAFTNEAWMKTLLESDAMFAAEEKYGLNKSSCVPKSSAKDEALDCLAGSYRKLET